MRTDVVEPRFGRERWILVLSLGASLLVGAAIASLNPTLEAFLVGAIAIVCLAPILSRALRRRLDIFEPLMMANLALFVMYVARPGALLTMEGPAMFKGYDISHNLREALILALVAAIAVQVGYALPWAPRLARRLSAVGGEWAVDTTVAYAIGLMVAGALMFGLFLQQAGGLGIVFELAAGRSSTQESYFRGSSAYLYSAPQLLWPASLLLVAVAVGTGRRALLLPAAPAMLALAIFSGGRGSRITLLPLLLSPFVYWYLARRRRPSWLALTIAGYLVFTVGIAYFRETRVQDLERSKLAELEKSVTNPTFELTELVMKGTDNDMFESLAAATLVVGEQVQPNPFDFAKRIVAKPIPSVIWRGKPVDPDERLNDVLFPNEQTRASSSTGLIGSWFIGGGIFGVAAGMALLGFLLRIPWEYLRRFPRSSAAQLVLTMTLMFIPMILRGGISDTIARALFGIVPILIALKVCRRPVEGEPA